MTPEAARWVYEQVLTGLVRSSISELRRCPCEGGVCWYCVLGDHGSCASRGPGGGLIVNAFRPETHLLSRTGAYRARVWRAGVPCRSRCPCGCPAAAPAGQLELFALSR